MQCWKIRDEKSKKFDNSPSDDVKVQSPTPETLESSRKWNFSLVLTDKLYSNEHVAVSGEHELGNWNLHKALVLIPNEDRTIWHNSIELISDKELRYRYFICVIDELNQNKLVRRWETHLNPRVIPNISERDERKSTDTFGDINGEKKIDRGWLTTETIIQFKFLSNPVFIKKNLKNRPLSIKITPINLRIKSNTENLILALEESISNCDNDIEQPANAFVEITSFKNSECLLSEQLQFGQTYNTDDFIIFHITLNDSVNVAYLIDLYLHTSENVDELPYHLGYHYILPNQLNKSDGHLELPITCAKKHRPIGTMEFDYLIIKPLVPSVCDLRTSYIRHWNKKFTGLDVGHRGSGASFKSNDNFVKVRENTIASFKKAASHGADMVEFDVQLSKDLIPVIYHDFEVCVSLKRKKILEDNDMLELPMRELTLEQLKNLKVYHVVEGRNREPSFFDEDLDEHQPFPKLSDVLELIDPHVGFNVEIKWPMQRKDGSMEHSQPIDRNLYVDCILNVIFSKAKERRIIFSCFDPDICTMLRYKQNIYPVMFLTQGITVKYPSYFDERCNTIDSAVKNALAMELLGIVAHTEDLLRDSSQINLAKDNGLIIFCWGDDNNCKDTIKRLKQLGLHAIIYDKMDILSSKENKKSIFLVEGKETQRDLFKLQHIELEKCKIPEYKNKDVEKVLELSDVREKLCLSTSTSTDSIN